MRLPRGFSKRTFALTAAALVGLAAIVVPIAGAQASPDRSNPTGIKHVWLIILENKSYDATFTGLNDNTYLWKTLPQQGVLLKDYFGTGHFSLDNYTSLVSGQGPNPDGQDDCPQYKDAVGSVINNPSNPNNGQWASAAGPNAAVGSNGCVYPADVPTLFNQFDAAHVSWKGYLQDLGNDPGRDDFTCGAPGNPAGSGVADPGSATATDQYVAKHSPFPWFHSLLDGTDCATKVTNLDNTLHRPLPRPAARVDDSSVQLDHPEQLQRRPRRRVPRQQPLRRLQPRRHAQAADQLHRRALRLRPVVGALHPDDREVPGLQGWRAHRHHL